MPTRSRVTRHTSHVKVTRATSYELRNSGRGSGVSLQGKGIYHLVIKVTRPQRIKIGALGYLAFAEGYYGYTGSAKAGFAGRVGRHLRKAKKTRWHIDYLLAHASVIEVWLKSGRVAECVAHRWLGRSGAAREAVARFGSSDCCCASHLWRYARRPVAPLGWRVLRV